MLGSCSKKTVPLQPPANATIKMNNKNDTLLIKKTDSAIAKKPPVKNTVKTAESTPKVITVNDNAARKTIDGRYYYDLLGHRYWRNNKDGKYYIYNKSMHNNPAFKKP